ncbi:hypothetical protein [Halioglobus sp. HI00S01]|uniref:hypothetical protein n=1 Tax=Halioglobus sp. HI00S01 TaxID=1822214 RepID=UPI0012E910E0|nr:hypothetical protein [Halioglobus sp. HI00S01]
MSETLAYLEDNGYRYRIFSGDSHAAEACCKLVVRALELVRHTFPHAGLSDRNIPCQKELYQHHRIEDALLNLAHAERLGAVEAEMIARMIPGLAVPSEATL